MPPGSRKIVRSSGGPRATAKTRPAFTRSPAESSSQAQMGRRNPFRVSASPDSLPKSSRIRELTPDDNESIFVKSTPQPKALPPSSPSSASDINPSSSVSPPSHKPVSNLPRSFAQSRQTGSALSNRSVKFNPNVLANRPTGLTGRGLANNAPSRAKNRVFRDAINGISTPSIRRLARRGGVKRISASIYNDMRIVLRDRLRELLRLTITMASHRSKIIRNDLTENQRGITVMLPDVLYALRSFGTPIYGFEHLQGTKKR